MESRAPKTFKLDQEHADSMRDGVPVNQTSITLLKGRVATLERENQELRDALFGLSHDVRDPARNANLTLGILARQLTGRLNEQDLTLMSAALQSTAAMNRLLDGMLAYTQVGTANKMSENAVGDLVALACENLSYMIRDTGAEMLIGGLPSVVCDRLQIVRLFQNLISNAIKYRRESAPPQVKISAERGGSIWIFQVRDNGIGFDSGQAKHIFELFSRLKKNKADGTGIGLPLCRKIVESHGGSIWAEAQPGQGSSFFFTLSTPKR